MYFNPRSLAGATIKFAKIIQGKIYFNPRSLAGATISQQNSRPSSRISIHAPSRERLDFRRKPIKIIIFQSTLPRGSDDGVSSWDMCAPRDFNPRSLAGATDKVFGYQERYAISIHAPSRERPHHLKQH